MNIQLLEYVRIELTRALADNSGGTKGQLEAFAEHPSADKNQHPRKAVHHVELEGGRRVKAENSSLCVMETRSCIRPMPPMHEHEYSSCVWRRAVMTLEEHQQAWLRYCYGFDLKFGHQETICAAVWSQYQGNLPSGLLRKTKKRLISLIWLAVQDVAAKNSNETYKEYAGSALANLMNVARSTWSEIYADHWQNMKLIIEALDQDSLQQVLNRKRDHILDEVE